MIDCMQGHNGKNTAEKCHTRSVSCWWHQYASQWVKTGLAYSFRPTYTSYLASFAYLNIQVQGEYMHETIKHFACSCSCSLAVLNPRLGHTMDVLSPFIPVLCHSDWLFHGESCPHLDVVHPGRAWPSSPSPFYCLIIHDMIVNKKYPS